MKDLMWRNIDMDYEDKDAVEDALALQMRAHELRAIEHERLAEESNKRGDTRSVSWNLECAALERADAKRMHEAYVKVCGGLGLRVIDCTVEVEEDVSDSEPGIETDPKSAA